MGIYYVMLTLCPYLHPQNIWIKLTYGKEHHVTEMAWAEKSQKHALREMSTLGKRVNPTMCQLAPGNRWELGTSSTDLFFDGSARSSLELCAWASESLHILLSSYILTWAGSHVDFIVHIPRPGKISAGFSQVRSQLVIKAASNFFPIWSLPTALQQQQCPWVSAARKG